ncbi:MAG: chemotaxis protein CheD [Lachnospiraceae bacterium]|nr:chemotaxis protein CheD [Lachnospiraceae bacterium]
MEEVIKVGIAEYKLCRKPHKITTIGLGSCVGIVLYSLTDEYCGLVHIMLPSSKEIINNSKRAKFADTGIEDLIHELEKKGVRKSSLIAKIAGGATMFQMGSNTVLSNSGMGSIGDRNVKSVKETLANYKIRIVAEDTGADYGRTIVFDPTTRDLIIRSAGKSEKII